MATDSIHNVRTAPELRKRLEERERLSLRPFAALARESRGRARPEDEHPYRTAYQRDRDRILHTKAFRRLKRKTQVFFATAGDHYRTRLTHTLEVAQIARTAARALFLNEDLVEAIALGHDLGHTPFGHAGEAVLNEVHSEGFSHTEQSVRIVDHLESTRHGRGLNLTFEVRDGILNHSRAKAILMGKPGPPPTKRWSATLEGDLVSVCDAVAYINHDIDDAVRGGLITLHDLPKGAIDALGTTSSERINTMVGALIEGSPEDAIDMTPDVREATWALRSYLYANLYPCEAISREIRKGKKIVRELYYHLLEHSPSEATADISDAPVLPGGETPLEDTLERRIVDLVAGMTDQYALDLYKRHFFPESWQA